MSAVKVSSERSVRKMTSKDFSKVIQEVSTRYNVTRKYLVDGERSSYPALPRQIAMYLCRVALQATFDDIAEKFNRQRPTVIRNVGKVRSLAARDTALSKTLSELGLTLGAAGGKADRSGRGNGSGTSPHRSETGQRPLAAKASHKPTQARKGAIAA